MKLPPIIGLTGRKYAGKTEAAKYLEAKYGYAGTPITDPMIEMADPLLKRMGIHDPAERMERLQPWGSRKDESIPGFEHLSGRKILQTIGKDFRDAVSLPTSKKIDENSAGTDSRFFYNLWLLDNARTELLCNQSVRYPFERDIIMEKNGVVWRVINPEAPDSGDTHPSERQDWPVTKELIAPHSKGIGYLQGLIDEMLQD